jgi:hypothetical protein
MVDIAVTKRHYSVTSPVLGLLMLGGQAFWEGGIPHVYW